MLAFFFFGRAQKNKHKSQKEQLKQEETAVICFNHLNNAIVSGKILYAKNKF